jgi:hypothetical protein
VIAQKISETTPKTARARVEPVLGREDVRSV